MSMADGLAHEREAEDDKTRRKVQRLMKTLRDKHGTQAPGDIGALEGKQYSISGKERTQILMYLDRYAKGDQLR